MESRITTWEAFDPLEGEAPHYVEGKMGAIATRARHIVGHRSREEIEKIGDLLSYLSEHPAAVDAHLAVLDAMAAALEQKEAAPAPALPSEPQALLAAQEAYSLEDYEDIPNLTWAEVFATLALVLMAEASERERWYEQQGRAEDDSLHWLNCAPYAVEAMEAVCLGEGFLRWENTEAAAQRLVKKKMSLNARKGGIQRHAATNQLKREFFHYYGENARLSQREAAKRFYEALPEEKKKLLAETNYLRTLTDALSKHLRAQTIAP